MSLSAVRFTTVVALLVLAQAAGGQIHVPDVRDLARDLDPGQPPSIFDDIQVGAAGDPGFGNGMLLGPTTAEYRFVTDNKVEVRNFLPEPFTGIAFDSEAGIWAVNPYANLVLRYFSSTTEPDLVVSTGLNPVSIAIWEPSAGARKLIVVCAGTHAAFIHDASSGRVLDVVQLESEPADLVLDTDNGWAFVSCQGTEAVLKLDLASFEVLDRYEIPYGHRPGPLVLDRGAESAPRDNRVYVAAQVTGNNSLPIGVGGNGLNVGTIRDLDGNPGGELPDQDVYRINPFKSGKSGSSAVKPAIRGAGSLLFDLERNPLTGAMWVLSTDSNNKDPQIDTEPKLRGKLGTNQLLTVAGVTKSADLVQAGAGKDLDDTLPGTPEPDYDPLRSINQARSVDFFTASSPIEGAAVIASPFSDVILITDAAGNRAGEFNLPPGAQCWNVRVYDAVEDLVLALCLGTMTIEVFTLNPPTPGPIASLPLLFDPTPDQIRRGRDVFLNGKHSRDARFSCATCHPRGMTDMLGWRLRGDPCDVKDVMVTQTLRSIADSFPHHWRGERDLPDFQKAFVGLLGADPMELDSLTTEPTDEEIVDFIAFVQSLQIAANPLQNPRRILDASRNSGPAPNGMFGNAAAGQDAFMDVPNFNGQSCGDCHALGSGTNAAHMPEIGSFTPRAQPLEIAHLRELPMKGLATVEVDEFQVNADGFGIAHNGSVPTLFNFIFDIVAFFALDEQQRVDVFKFTQQFDHGLSAGAHWARFLGPLFTEEDAAEIEQVLLEGAHKGWNDVVAFGVFDFQSGKQAARWAYDAGSQLFVSDRPAQRPLTWPELLSATQAGQAEQALVGLPPGEGRHFGIDQDNDLLVDGEERDLGLNVYDPDVDDDGWPDGYELAHMDDPEVPQASSSDSTPPTLVLAELDHTTSRMAKYHVRFDEPCSFSVTYGTSGGFDYTFERGYAARQDTFVLTHHEPKTPTFAAPEFTARITLTDLAGNSSGPFNLPGFAPTDTTFTLADPPLLHAHVADLQWEAQDRNDTTLDARVRVKMDFNYGAPAWIPVDGQRVFLSVFTQDLASETGGFELSTDFSSTLDDTFFILDAAENTAFEYPGLPGKPWILSEPLVDGETVIEFSQGGLTLGQEVKVSVMGLVFEATPEPGYNGPLPVYDLLSLFQLQPLFLEDSMELKLEF